MKHLIFIFLAVSCLGADRVAEKRQALPYVSKVRSSLSMAGYQKGDELNVKALGFDQIKPGIKVMIWPANQPIPVFHIARYWVGTPNRKQWVCSGDTGLGSVDTISEDEFIGTWEAKK
jgi:hypothetical protein